MDTDANKTAPTFDEIVAEAERMWAVTYPKRNPDTYTAIHQQARLFGAARRALLAR